MAFCTTDLYFLFSSVPGKNKTEAPRGEEKMRKENLPIIYSSD